MLAYDRRTEDALVTVVDELPPDSSVELLDKLKDCAAEAALRWQDILDGTDERQPSGNPARRNIGITPSDGDGDQEHPSAPALGSIGIQKLITAATDTCLRESLYQDLENSGRWEDLRRLRELADKDVDHTWLWHLSKHHGPILSSQEFVEAVRARLGAAGPSELTPCARCGQIFDSAGSHASCCAIAEATKGHYAVSRLVHEAALMCDPSADTEVCGLIPGTDLRPADVLTTALGNCMTAIDVCVASPHAQNAGDDCTEGAVRRKLRTYGPHLEVLSRQNIDYTPLVWSCYGRPHANTLSVLRTLSKRISRRRSVANEAAVMQHLLGSISVEIWRRVAQQVISCWPAVDDGVDWRDHG